MKLILVVDDQEDIRRMVQEMLVMSGFMVVIARDGVEALEIISKGKPDCVVTDLEMPFMNGIEMAREVKRLFPQIPVIMMTGMPGLAEGAPVFRVIAKPINFPELIGLVKSVTGEPVT